MDNAKNSTFIGVTFATKQHNAYLTILTDHREGPNGGNTEAEYNGGNLKEVEAYSSTYHSDGFSAIRSLLSYRL